VPRCLDSPCAIRVRLPTVHRSRPPLSRLGALARGAILAAALLASPASAQRPGLESLPLPGSETESAIRLRQLLGLDPSGGYLLRSVGSRVTALQDGADTAVVMLPEFFTTYNSAHPWGFNDGPLRAGRGINWMASAGFAARVRRVSLVLVPQMVHEANLAFQTIPYPQPTPPVRNVWANPFYPLPTSLDYPQRFGDAARSSFSVQGRLAVDALPHLRAGISNENVWWGPGVRNGLLLSAHGPGFEHIVVESPAPIDTRFGAFEYQYLLGRLEESEFFDFDRSNDVRSLSAAAVTWQAPRATGEWPTIGAARAVMATGAPGLRTTLDFAQNTGRPWSRPADAASERDQIFLLFARWLFPAQGAEAYLEWARYEQAASLRDILEQPGHMQGYTLGAQWAVPYREGTLHLQTELSYMEPSASIRVRPVGTSYTSPAVPQGWTHQGQMLGPSIGPGGSSQWAAADFRRERWRTGITLGRLRRDANYRFLNPLPPKREDLSLYASLRAGWRLGPLDALVEYTDGIRLNHLYQAYEFGTPDGRTEGIDLKNRTLTLTLTPRLPAVTR
jgi:hypothetical protein